MSDVGDEEPRPADPPMDGDGPWSTDPPMDGDGPWPTDPPMDGDGPRPADPPTGEDGPWPGDPPLDAEDRRILDGLRRVHASADPVPDTLLDRLRFVLALENVMGEVLSMTEEIGAAPGARGGEESRTITFDSESLTIMVAITVRDDERVRLDGWLAPVGDHLVELRTSRGLIVTRADDQGRFTLEGVPRGLAQIVIRQALDVGPRGTILAVTPSMVF
ncbi:hypothetical protein [Sphaerisporangium corydalis]|uniref:Carboxypeptidase regulatory-like domain-containing protein n=1 Tax=Sphaerisporangium corydalis TaxID=1441875 RepID=A0ABV9ELK7_9ACTN|nr:hypothetical protein [Sphaerisporangium corydalis]